ncbi:MAG: type II secretion system F family protein [Candidatus Omnitrophota bacterium]
MPKFMYVAKESNGRTVKGEIEGADKKYVLDLLRSKNLLILKLEETVKKKSLFSGTKIFGRKKIKMEELVVFARQMATMTSAGITIVSSLETLAEQIDNPRFKKVLKEVKDAVNTGASFSEAMSKYSEVFSDYFINMVKAGESSGMLEDVLERVASYLEKSNTLQKKIKSAMIYPGVVTSMALAITLVMIIKVIPVFKDMFAGFGSALPAPTQILINISDITRKYFGFFVIGFIIAMISLKMYIATDKGKFVLDSIKLKLPVFGPLFKKVSISKFTRTLATLVKSGVPILSALEIVAKTSGNLVVERSIYKVKESVREGETIAEPLEKSGIFPPVVIRMVSVGEKSGQLETMLTKIADFSDEQVDVVVDSMTSLIEPLIIAFLGIVIGGIVICMFLPVFKISTLIRF